MDQRSNRKPPPALTDIDGWRAAVADGSFAGFRLEALVAALQDLGPSADTNLKRALAKRLSDGMLRTLRRFVGLNHPNKGEDVIHRVHGQLFAALLDPTTADGQALRAGFASIVSFRVKDAIATERRHSRIPVQVEVKRKGKDKTETDATLVPTRETPEPSNDAEAIDGEDAQAHDSKRDLTLLDGVRDLDEQIDVTRILNSVTDERKRLAFYLYMDGVPFRKTKGNSIAKALGMSAKTVTQWVEEVRTLLQSNKEVQDLTKMSIGDNT